jgi:hypothetical protein
MTAVMVWKTRPPGGVLVLSRTKYAMAATKPKTPIQSRKVPLSSLDLAAGL